MNFSELTTIKDYEITEECANGLAYENYFDESEFIFKDLIQNGYFTSSILNNLASISTSRGEWKDVLFYSKLAINLSLESPEIFNNLGNAYRAKSLFDQAYDAYQNALNLSPLHIQANFNKGLLLYSQAKYDEAKESFLIIIRQNPKDIKAKNCLGSIALKQNDYELAGKYFADILKIQPNSYKAMNNLGNLYRSLNQHQKAINYYVKALEISSSNIFSLNGLGKSYIALGYSEKGINFFKKAIIKHPNNPNAYRNLALFYKQKTNYILAKKYFLLALQLDPSSHEIQLSLMQLCFDICDWTIFDMNLSLLNPVRDLSLAIPPLPFMSFCDDPYYLKNIACNFHKKYFDKPIEILKIKQKEKVCIGYFSSNFYEHPVMQLLIGILENHNLSNFSIIAFSLKQFKEDKYTKRIKKCVTQFVDVSQLSDREIVFLAREYQVDIAIDLMGYTEFSRPSIFSERLAPIQISYLGYPGTLGSQYMDYLFADEILVPKEYEEYYSEKIIYIPQCYQCNDDKLTIGTNKFTRSDFCLPLDSFVFTCFNNSHKIQPKIFGIWMQILNAVDKSVLWIYKTNDLMEENLKIQASLQGVDPCRLIFTGKLPLKEHIARHQCADLFLDTFNYSAGATAMLALKSGLPILSFAGKSYTARMSSSLLNSIDMKELVAKTEKEYICKAIDLASNTSLLTRLKQELSNKINTNSLFISSYHFTRNLEKIYANLHSKKYI